MLLHPKLKKCEGCYLDSLVLISFHLPINSNSIWLDFYIAHIKYLNFNMFLKKLIILKITLTVVLDAISRVCSDLKVSAYDMDLNYARDSLPMYSAVLW